jgi:hypothetical protein
MLRSRSRKAVLGIVLVVLVVLVAVPAGGVCTDALGENASAAKRGGDVTASAAPTH